jgi:hypothetical protein
MWLCPGGYLLLGAEGRMFSLRYADVHHRSPLQLGLLASTSDGGLKGFNVTQHNWTAYADAYGTATLPLRQTFTAVSRLHEVVVDYHATIDQFFRIPITIEKQGKQKVLLVFVCMTCLAGLGIGRPHQSVV